MKRMTKKYEKVGKGYLGKRIGGAVRFYATRRRDRIFLAGRRDFSDKFF
jgi:hypothetical protein